VSSCLAFQIYQAASKTMPCLQESTLNVSVDPMRVVSVPGTLNAKTGLICSYLGDRRDFEPLTIGQIVEKSKDFCKFHRDGYPEFLESPLQRVFMRR
jgi:hypothetical protein